MLAPAIFTNIRIGQGYLIVFALFAAAVLWLSHQRDARGGAPLGLVLGLKLSGTALLVVLAAQRRWRAIAVAGAVAIALALAVTPFIDAAMWWQHPDVVRGFVQRPSGSVTAYTGHCPARMDRRPHDLRMVDSAGIPAPLRRLAALVGLRKGLVKDPTFLSAESASVLTSRSQEDRLYVAFTSRVC
jgi:hypothetical protein